MGTRSIDAKLVVYPRLTPLTVSNIYSLYGITHQLHNVEEAPPLPNSVAGLSSARIRQFNGG